MKILLPPSETKRAGGAGAPLQLTALALPQLEPLRRAAVDALVALAADANESRRVLKLSERQAGDVAHNAALWTAQTMPAADRYTGVLYDALDAGDLDAAAREFLGDRVLIHSAPFGLIGALDSIPSYRLAAGTSLPGLAPLRRHWASATSEALGAEGVGFVLDVRSEAYVALGPVPHSVPSAYIRVVTDDASGTRALNHFNKKAKGQLVRAFVEARPEAATGDEFRHWADARGWRFRDTSDPRVWELVVAQ